MIITQRQPAPLVAEFSVGTHRVRVGVEVAQTPAQLRQGLMHRTHLPADRGMLLTFPHERVQALWMKNTLIPLDMIFVSRTGQVVGVIMNAAPLSLTSRSIPVPARYVVEVNAGFARQHGIGPGATMRLDVDSAYGVL